MTEFFKDFLNYVPIKLHGDYVLLMDTDVSAEQEFSFRNFLVGFVVYQYETEPALYMVRLDKFVDGNWKTLDNHFVSLGDLHTLAGTVEKFIKKNNY